MEIMKKERCSPDTVTVTDIEELKRDERKFRRERIFLLWSVIFLAATLLTAAILAKESFGYTIVSSAYTSVGFVLVMMLDKASKKLRKVRREMYLR